MKHVTALVGFAALIGIVLLAWTASPADEQTPTPSLKSPAKMAKTNKIIKKKARSHFTPFLSFMLSPNF
jgi:hypothetical protein